MSMIGELQFDSSFFSGYDVMCSVSDTSGEILAPFKSMAEFSLSSQGSLFHP